MRKRKRLQITKRDFFALGRFQPTCSAENTLPPNIDALPPLNTRLETDAEETLTPGPARLLEIDGEAFRAGYPRWREVETLRDPAIMSDFWRRVTAGAA